MLWLVFFALATVVYLSGKNLVKYGDIIAEKLNLSRTIIGIIFIASITSLPELITGISSVTYADSPDIAGGGVFGSCMFNLFILAVLDGLYRNTPITTKIHHGFTISASFGIILITVAVAGILFNQFIPNLGWISLLSLIIIAVYIIAVYIITRYEKRFIKKTVKEVAVSLDYEEISLKEAVFKYLINSVLIIVSATFLPEVGKILSHKYGLTETFFGTFFIALTTSLPEVAVSFSAVKMNLVTIAVANLLGSNIFNISILAINDIFFTKGSLFSFMDKKALLPAIFSILMSSVVIIGLIYRAERKIFRLAIEAIVLITLYTLGMILTFYL